MLIRPSQHRTNDEDVLQAARRRIARVFADFSRMCVSFSGGKDSTVMLHLVAEEARRVGRRFGLLFVDLEAQYKLTIEFVDAMFREYADCIEPFWLALPLYLRNAVSSIQPRWVCWDPDAEALWVRHPPESAIRDWKRFPFWSNYHPDPALKMPVLDFGELTDGFNRWFADGKPAAFFVGTRAQESLNRWRAVSRRDVSRYAGLRWTVRQNNLVNAYPIYDWKTEDIWTYHARMGCPYNALYDRMHQAGLTIHQQRICQPYGDDQRKGLWLYHVIEPETWGRVVARVAGANSGALYAMEPGNILGRLKVTKPDGHTWKSFARLLLETMPAQMAEHYRNKIAVWVHWWEQHGVPQEQIADEASARAEAQERVPTWRRVCKVLLRNDYWCKGLSFCPTGGGDAYKKYNARMKKLREEWRIDL